MKVDLMRKIDFYIDVPLCLLFSIFFKTISLLKTCRDKLIFRPKRKIQPKNVLFIELSEMGSAILVDPAMKKLQKSLIGSELFFVIFKRNKFSLNLLNTVKEENIFTISEDSFLPLTLDTLRFLMWTRARR